MGGWYLVDITLTVPNELSTQTDALDDTVNYAEVYQVIKEEMAVPSKLIENVAGRIARRVKSEFSLVSQVNIKLSKKHPPIPGANINAAVELCL